jgi:hypothetical protein
MFFLYFLELVDCLVINLFQFVFVISVDLILK